MECRSCPCDSVHTSVGLYARRQVGSGNSPAFYEATYTREGEPDTLAFTASGLLLTLGDTDVVAPGRGLHTRGIRSSSAEESTAWPRRCFRAFRRG